MADIPIYVKPIKLWDRLLDSTFLDENGRIKEDLKFKINIPQFNIQNSKISGKPNDKFETTLFLPEGEDRQGEGGLRTRGYFKHSYKLIDGEWYIVDWDDNPIMPAPEEIQTSINHYLSTISYQQSITALPLVSVVTVVYNGEKYLEDTIQSVINQTYPNVEYIIIDGGSTDGTLDIIKKYEDYIDYWVSEKDKGIYSAMNKGIYLATGEYIIFLNAADTFATDGVLENIAQRIEKINPKIIYGGVNVYTEDGKFLSSLKPLTLNKKNLNRYGTRVVCHQSIFVHRDIIKLYSYKYRLKGELNWYYDLVESTNKNKIIKLDKIVCNYFLGGTGDKNFWENYFERIKVTKEHNLMFGFILVVPFFVLPLIFRMRRKIFGK